MPIEEELAAKLHSDFDGAIDLLERTMMAGEYLPSLTYCLFLKEEKWPELAAAYLERLHGIFPEEAATPYELALLKASDAPSDSKTLLRMALEIRPDFVNAFRLLAFLYLRDNQERDIFALLESEKFDISASEKTNIVQVYTYLQYVSKQDLRNWIRHEFLNANVRTFVSCMNAARTINLHLSPSQLATRTSIHLIFTAAAP